MKLYLVLISIFFALQSSLLAQKATFKTKTFDLELLKSTSKVIENNNFHATIIHLEAPSPNGDSYRSFLMQQKIESKNLFPYQSVYSSRSTKASNVPSPIITKSFGMMELNIQNVEVPIYGGLPNDNTAAVSDDGILLLSINSSVYLKDLNTDSVLYPGEYLTLREVFNLPFGNYYDPKVIYDKDFDRFVLVFLKNNVPATSELIVGFSKTNNPIDGWNVYSLPGNPLDNNRWTDFPSIALSDSSLFFSANLIIPNVSWQVGFDGSVLWEMKKSSGFKGDTSIAPKLYHDIKFGDNYIRNLHCVQGADGNVKNLHLFSNRNFDIQNDTVFLVSLLPENADSSYLKVEALISDLKYGVPPNARQADTDTTDATKGLQTNDARVLGAIEFENEIQFVSNSINPETGFSSIYHGTVNDLHGSPFITANLISDPIKDFGYPNIAWTGNEACDRETMIAFNHTSFTDTAGISAIYYNNVGEYSDVIALRKGQSIVDRISNDSYERWGDYFGMQRKYNEPGKVYTFGFTTDKTKKNFGWVNELVSPDTSVLGFTYKIVSKEEYCQKQIEITAFGGVPPYSAEWNNSNTNTSLVSDYYCSGDSVFVKVFDSRSCQINETIFIEIKDQNNPLSLFPNPTSNQIAFQFTATEATELEVRIVDSKGSFMEKILFQDVKKGLNELSFSTEPLAKGIYYVEILDGKTILKKTKFVKK